MSAEKKYISRCFVPECENNYKNASTKAFLIVPENRKRRKLWFSLARRSDTPRKSNFYCSENYLNVSLCIIIVNMRARKLWETFITSFTQTTKCAYSASFIARKGADHASRVRSPRHADASSYATHIAGT